MAAIRPDGWRQAVQMLAQGDTRSDVAALDGTVPVQIVFGGEDRITPPEFNRRIASARSDALVHEIAGAGHAVYIEKAEEFDRLINQFIDANRAPRSKHERSPTDFDQ
jgi:pimeloyl-ACP methyl ester carboxylesterase